jgi:uncharacterized lipoprotein YddW (UPF0748 family)
MIRLQAVQIAIALAHEWFLLVVAWFDIKAMANRCMKGRSCARSRLTLVVITRNRCSI